MWAGRAPSGAHLGRAAPMASETRFLPDTPSLIQRPNACLDRPCFIGLPGSSVLLRRLPASLQVLVSTHRFCRLLRKAAGRGWARLWPPEGAGAGTARGWPRGAARASGRAAHGSARGPRIAAPLTGRRGRSLHAAPQKFFSRFRSAPFPAAAGIPIVFARGRGIVRGWNDG